MHVWLLGTMHSDISVADSLTLVQETSSAFLNHRYPASWLRPSDCRSRRLGAWKSRCSSPEQVARQSLSLCQYDVAANAKREGRKTRLKIHFPKANTAVHSVFEIQDGHFFQSWILTHLQWISLYKWPRRVLGGTFPGHAGFSFLGISGHWTPHSICMWWAWIGQCSKTVLRRCLYNMVKALLGKSGEHTSCAGQPCPWNPLSGTPAADSSR